MSKNTSIIIIVGLLIAIAIVVIGGSVSRGNTNTNQAVENSEVKDGVQYITINARGGYSPQVSNARAGIPTKLIVKTNGTYDCSAALVIRELNFQKILPQTGETVIDLGTPLAGKPLQGTCSMGMYNFLINFS